LIPGRAAGDASHGLFMRGGPGPPLRMLRRQIGAGRARQIPGAPDASARRAVDV
jgi:hypothetical protein